MIRSSKTTLRFANASKRSALEGIMREYHRVVCAFVDILWDKPHKEVRSLLDKEITSSVPTFLSARLIQCAGKQASGVVRGTRQKREQRMYQHKKLVDEGKLKQARKLMAYILRYDAGKPNMKSGLPMELDERFCAVELEVGSKKFDGWLSLVSLGLNEKIKVPFKRTKHFNELLQQGNLKKGVRLSSRSITFIFDIPDPPPADHGKTAGIDIGMTTAFAVSFGDQQWMSEKCAHGHDLTTICQKISRRKKGSKGFRRAQQHRKNYINQQVNLIPLDGVRQINIEGIKDMRRNKKSSRFMSHFTYTALLERLKSTSEERGVLVNEVDPAFTSQRCSCCGWTREANRKGKKFQCGKCGFKADADLNASLNLSLDLPVLSRTGKKRPDNKKGFYWRVLGPGKEPMSPLCSETSHLGVR